MQKKRTISLLLAIMMLFSLLPTSAFAAGSDESSGSTEKTREEVIENTSVQLMKDGAVRTDTFQQTETSVDVKVQLDETVQQCYMTVYAYIGTARFDPDNSASSFVLWKGQVSSGTITCPFNTEVALKVGYKIIACVNTPAGKDAEGSQNYAYVNSQAVEVVDENGQAFQPYVYPDITIDEKTLEPGATTLHISMTGDERIFAAAQAGKIDINYTIGMYPAEDSFEIEDGSTIALVQLGETTEALHHYEVNLSQPLKAGWRVRAVAYWDNCPDLFIARGNDYQSGQTDDSVLVSGMAEEDVPTVTIGGTVAADTKSISVTLGGKIPTGSVLILRSFEKDTTEYTLSGGSWVATQANAESKTYALAPAETAIASGRKLVAFILNSGEIIAQSQPVIITEAKPTVSVGTVTLNESSYSADATQATVTVTGCEEYQGGILFITTGKPATDGDDSRGRLGQIAFTGAGTYTIPFTNTQYVKMEVGNTVQAYLFKYDSQKDRTNTKFSDSVPIITGETSGEKTQEEILKNTTVTLVKNGEPRTENFKQSEKSVDVKVQLDDSLEQCYMTIFAYSSNTTFDPDASYNKRLWTGYVQNGQTVTCTFNQELPLYHNVIACLNVPVGEDFYRPSNSQALEVVDDSGEGFKDYTYPDASIVETALEPGANKLHIRLTGDERLFQAAKEEKTSITVAVGQYPNDGTTFDFEGEKQISLASNLIFTEPQKNYEVTLSQPLKAGWRVRAVVYWRQNESIFLAKGNDYEAMFQRPDDSVLVSGTPEEDVPAVSIQGTPKAGDTSVTVQLGGKIPDGTYIVLKKYDAGTADADCVLSGGTFLANRSASAAGEQTLTVPALNAGDKLVAFLTNNGQIAKSQPVTAAAAQTTPLFTITPKGALTADSTQITFTVTSSDPSITSVGAFLCPVKNGSVDSDHCIARQLGQELGDITLDIPAGKLKDGDVVRLILNYEKGDDYPYYFGTEANNITVGAQVPVEDSVVLNESAFTTDATQATVTVTGCGSFQGGYLILTTGRASSNDDADSRNRLGSVTFTGPGTYTVPFSNSRTKLTSGNTIQAHLYKLDDADITYYKYSNAVGITSGSQPAVKPEVSIATDSITADRTDIWVQTSFDGALTGTLKLYTYTGETFAADKAKEIYSGTISSSSNSQKITFGSEKLTAGEKLIAVLELSNGSTVQSEARTIQAAPEKEKPVATILTQKVTAGMTTLYANLRFDSRIHTADYKLYQFEGNTLDLSTATLLVSGSLYNSQTKQSLYMGTGKLKVGSKLQLVLTAGGEEARSNVITVEPSPDWGTPYTAFSVSAVKSNAKTVSLSTDYSDEYLTMGDDFYCDVTVYACSGGYTDDEIEDKELWENYTACRTVAKANSRLGAATKGDLTLTLFETANLKAGEKLFIKLRLPHTEWEGEEVDYVSASIPVIGADDEIPAYQVVLYNLDQDSSRGARLRSILADLNIPAQEMTYAHLNETVGYLAGLDGYEAAKSAYDGKEYSAEFMLLCNLPETLLDRFLDAMQDNGLRIDHKAVVTAYNQDMELHKLMGDISEEHDVFQMLLTLNNMVTDSEKLTEKVYGSSQHWKAFQTALSASDALLRSEEPTYEAMKAAYDALKAEYLAVTNLREIKGEAAITISEEDGGTYTMTATVEEGLANTSYQYTWSNGQTTQTITGIPAERLIATTVSVTGEGLYGKLTAQLNVPSSVLPAVTAGPNALSVQLNAAGAGRNIPAATKYVVALYQGNTLVETKTVSTVQTVAFSGLSSGTAYTLKSYAVSPVGRSDILSQTVTTASGSSGGHTSGGGNSSRPSDPKPPVNDPSTGFTDVKNDAYYADAVKWAVDRGITNGQTTTLFGAEASCTRAQIVTFLWRAAGSPVLQTTKNPFTDLSEDAYYYQAVLWAVEQGITVGTTETTFDPDQTCTRGEAVTFLHRNAGEPVAAGNHGFQDVNGSDYYDNAVQWAKEKSITSGTTETTFSPSAHCTRGQIVTFLYRNLGN